MVLHGRDTDRRHVQSSLLFRMDKFLADITTFHRIMNKPDCRADDVGAG